MWVCLCHKGNIDQVQYCDKIKNIVDFLGTHLSDDELTKIWKMQVCLLDNTNTDTVDNVNSAVLYPLLSPDLT